MADTLPGRGQSGILGSNSLNPIYAVITGGTSGLATEATLEAVLAALNIYVTGETPGGTINGTNTVFTTFYAFKPGTTHFYLNGVRLREGPGFDYLEGNNHQTLTFLTSAPMSGDILLVDYIKA